MGKAKIIYYANTREDAASIGFDDNLIYEEKSISIKDRNIILASLSNNEANIIFQVWVKKVDKNAC